MKIGILTLPQEMNYGGILQAFAMQKVLRDMGHEVYTIDRHNRREYPSLWVNILGFGKRWKQFLFEHKDVSLYWNPQMSDEVYRKISANTRDFVSRNMQMTRECWSDELAEIEAEYKFDVYVVGSDQVWLPGYYPNSFLDFVKRSEVVRVIYAASCGQHSFAEHPLAKKTAKDLASKFSGISVRESALVKLSQDVLGMDATHVLDPTMLLTPEDYLAATTDNVGQEAIVFSYILDKTSDKQSLVDFISRKVGAPSVAVNAPKGYVKRKGINLDECVFPPIDNWIRNLYRAEYVVTDSFHGTAFSILFNKQFVVVGNKQRGMERFKSILKLFGLEDRLVLDYNHDEIEKIMASPIDYEKVNTRLEEMRKLSREFLLKSLKNEII